MFIHYRNASFKKIDGLIRDNAKELKVFDLRQHKQMQDLFLKAIDKLPNDRKEWFYGYQSVNKARPYIDQLSTLYLETYHAEEMEELETLLDEQVAVNKRLYGEGSDSSYKENKLDELYERMGNAVLTQMREYQKEVERPKKRTSGIRNGKYYYYFNPLTKGSELRQAMFLLNKTMRKTYHDYQNERHIAEFDRMLEGYNHEM
ncbi:relaxase MobL [Aneurinibacillus thermoaerophilus]|uniref:relaxase MobL n=1 Tax=Aneurinibacillus thermoaerophilus TaxID=143495 RepID=UPI002E1D2842